MWILFVSFQLSAFLFFFLTFLLSCLPAAVFSLLFSCLSPTESEGPKATTTTRIATPNLHDPCVSVDTYQIPKGSEGSKSDDGSQDRDPDLHDPCDRPRLANGITFFLHCLICFGSPISDFLLVLFLFDKHPVCHRETQEPTFVARPSTMKFRTLCTTKSSGQFMFRRFSERSLFATCAYMRLA